MATRDIGSRVFTLDDQLLFAQFSGDVNPMHVDPDVARRLMTGRPVVHGMHLLLTALEYWQSDPLLALSAVSCQFDSPVSVGDPVVVTQHELDDHHHEISVLVDGLVCARIGLTLAILASDARQGSGTQSGVDSKPVASMPLTSPLDIAPEDHVGKTYAIGHRAVPEEWLPKARAHLGQAGFHGVICCSYFVGMVCPGMHSVFSSLAVAVSAEGTARDTTVFSVQKYDARFGLFQIAATGGIAGSLRAFVRARPKRQSGLCDLVRHVAQDEFAGTRALIVGGSRGLGEVTAKLIAAGGGRVDISYASGEQDARRIADEINAFGASACQAWRLDLMNDSMASIDIPWSDLDAVYFFATPKIFRRKSELFEKALFQQFFDFYVDRFYGLCSFLERAVTSGIVRVYLPSTVAIDERPKGLAEYAMAKAAAELLSQDINRSFKHVVVTTTRLPRLDTDQTSTIIKVPSESNVRTLLPIVREMQTSSD
ncbi:SDR family NAD(P)-dependent oxidoreductase [Comamonadaceae bacterium G21597-S1]|nr:SDR family NAD(P)-dependent oxidoreductase [Comamonadaceae bacterium G21597-S1]